MTPAELATHTSLEWISERCEEEGDCLLWKHSVNGSGQPRYTFRVGKTKYSRHLRQVVWALAGNSPVKDKHVITVDCGNPSCLNHAHMRMTSKKAVITKTARLPDVKRRVTVAAAAFRRPRAKITMEQACYVRECEKTLTVLAAELGISVAWASKIRRGEAWRDLRAGFFSGLGA